MLEAFKLPIGWRDLVRRTASEVMSDNCLGLAAQLAYYFFLALFPALLVLVALLLWPVAMALIGGLVFLAAAAVFRGRLPAVVDHCKQMCSQMMSGTGAGRPAAPGCQ